MCVVCVCVYIVVWGLCSNWVYNAKYLFGEVCKDVGWMNWAEALQICSHAIDTLLYPTLCVQTSICTLHDTKLPRSYKQIKQGYTQRRTAPQGGAHLLQNVMKNERNEKKREPLSIYSHLGERVVGRHWFFSLFLIFFGREDLTQN